MRATKVTRKVNDWEKAPGNMITCPKCGKILQKSMQTNSIICCPRCGYENYTWQEGSMKMQCSASLLEAENAGDYLRTIVRAMQMLRQSPVREYDFIPEDDPV